MLSELEHASLVEQLREMVPDAEIRRDQFLFTEHGSVCLLCLRRRPEDWPDDWNYHKHAKYCETPVDYYQGRTWMRLAAQMLRGEDDS